MSDRIRAEQARADSQRVDKLIGEVLANRYQIESRLGEGAMGSVYRARHIKVGRPFAVKVLHPRLLTDDKTLQRFEREAELAGRLHHPNVIGVVDVGETTDGLRYMVMDFAEGHDLATLLNEAPMLPERVINLTRQMLEGLYHAHEAGLIHRDFKPENVIVEKDAHGEEVPRIVDFGIAILREAGDPTNGTGRLTTNGLVLGTPHYMAPEQAVNDPIDHRIDLFALGIMIYEMLCGKLPFDGHGAEVARANLLLDPPKISDRVPYLEVDPLLEAFARRLMLKKRDQRPATAKVALTLLALIDNDREAAAVELGVPVAIARTVQSTEPVQPRHLSNDYPGTFPPPFRESKAPTMNNAVAVRAKTPASGVELTPRFSEPLQSDSLAFEVQHKPKRIWVMAALVAALLLGVGVIAIVATRGDSKPAPTPPPPLVAIETPKPTPTPPIAKVEPPVVETTPPVVDTKVKTTQKPIIKKPTPATKIETPVTKIETVTKVETPAIKTTKPVPPPVVVYDASAFRTHWQTVGAELKTFSLANGVNTITDLQNEYNAISFMTAAASQESRDAAKKTLDDVRTKLAARKK
ncbi:MAG TPA: protein kinase, partial [Kofleriaceae bacterium]